MSEPIEETVWTVARDGNAISSYVEPDVTLATVIKTTTYGDPEPVKA